MGHIFDRHTIASGSARRNRRASNRSHEILARRPTLGDLHRATPWLWLHFGRYSRTTKLLALSLGASKTSTRSWIIERSNSAKTYFRELFSYTHFRVAPELTCRRLPRRRRPLLEHARSLRTRPETAAQARTRRGDGM